MIGLLSRLAENDKRSRVHKLHGLGRALECPRRFSQKCVGTNRARRPGAARKDRYVPSVSNCAVKASEQTPIYHGFYEAQEKELSHWVPWPEKRGGYAEGVFDDELPEHVRFYVGQSSRLLLCISAEHSALNENVKAVHYFVLARG